MNIGNNLLILKYSNKNILRDGEFLRRRTPINLKMGKTMPGFIPGGRILDGQDFLSSVHPEMKIFVQDQGMRKK